MMGIGPYQARVDERFHSRSKDRPVTSEGPSDRWREGIEWLMCLKATFSRALVRAWMSWNTLPPPFLQMPIKRAEAQTPTPTKLAASHAAAYKLSH